MDFGFGNIQRVGDQRNGSFVDIAELILQGMQNRQQRARQMLQFPDAGESPIRVPN